MSGLFGGGGGSYPIYTPEPLPSSEESDIAAKEAAASVAAAQKKKKGYPSTIITGPSGLVEPPTTLKKTLGD